MNTATQDDRSRIESAFTASDGVEIRYFVFGALDDHPVVLHHGFGADTRMNWLAPGFVSALLGRGRSVVSIDARGHGESGKPHDPRFYGERAMARDLGHLLDRLKLPSCDLVGYSMGAIVSSLLAATDARIRRLVLGGIGAGAVELGGVDTRVLPSEAVVHGMETSDLGSIPDPMVLQFRAFADAVGADRVALAAQGRAMHAEPIAFERITARTLILAGKDDPLAARPEVLAKAIAGAELVRVSGDHMNALIDPDFKKAILGFLG